MNPDSPEPNLTPEPEINLNQESPEIKPDLVQDPFPSPLMHEVPKKQKPKILMFIMIPVLIALGAIGVLAYQKYFPVKPAITPSPTPTTTVNPTENWAMYTNNIYGLSFKYPNNLTVYKCGGETTNSCIGSKTQCEGKADGQEIDCVFLDTEYANPSLDFTKIDSRYKNLSDQIRSDFPEFTEAKMNGKTVYLVNTSYDDENGKGVSRVAYFEVGNNMIGSFNGNYDTENQKDLFNQILSTFKFTNATGTYSCPENGYIDCMPGTEIKQQCSTEAISWYEKNCQDFKGVAY